MPFELSIGSNTRKSPYFGATVADGARSFYTYNHMLMPAHFGDPEGEYDRLLNGAAMWDVAGERQVELRGKDAGALAQYLTGRDLTGTKVGQGRYVPLCNYRGNVINDPVLLKLDEDRYWLSVGDSDIHLWAEAVGAERRMDAYVSEPDVSPLAIQGPLAEDVVATLFGDWVKTLKYFWFRETELAGIPMVVARSGWSKQGGFELYLMDGTRGSDLWALVKEAGQPFGIGPSTPNGVERLESGLLSYGGDFRVQDYAANPFELGFGPLISFNHDFIGRTALEEIAKTGPERRFVGFFLDGDPVISAGHPVDVLQDGKKVGYISSTAYSPRLERNIGVGMVPFYAADGTSGLIAALPDGPRRIVVTSLPFIS